jgi:alpha-D-ribose 1-methylphosphonate 5-triphosphate synthase subunit PhnH
MKLDLVHDIQIAFRHMVRACSFPGEIVNLEEIAEKIDLQAPLGKGMLLVALTLLDAETGFCVYGEKAEEVSVFLSRMTYSARREIGEADFVFVTEGDTGNLEPVFSSAFGGTLVDPQLGATLVIEVPVLDSIGNLSLSGPGIENKKSFGTGKYNGWVTLRNEKNREFPLGVDIVFIDSRARLAMLPRTTVVAEG